MGNIQMKAAEPTKRKATERRETLMTLERLKKYGEFIKFCEIQQGYLYTIDERMYKINGQGITEIW